MKHYYLHSIFNNNEICLGDVVVVCGLIYARRTMKNICFLEINDGTTMNNLQLVVDKSVSCFEQMTRIEMGSTVQVEGRIENNDKNDFIEMHVYNAEVLGRCQEGCPIQKNKMSFEYLRSVPHLRTRLPYFKAVLKIRSVLNISIHDFFSANYFTNINTPIITGSDCEGAGAMFRLNTHEGVDNKISEYFGRKVFLSVSGQLELEAMVSSFGKVYGLGPVFRADDSNTKRHASEFWMLETEMAYADLYEAMDFAEETIKYLISTLLQRCQVEFDFLSMRHGIDLIEKMSNILQNKFVRVDYSKAINILKDVKSFEYPVEYGIGFRAEHINYLQKYYQERPFFVTNHPKETQPFYVKANEDDKTVSSAILYFPGVGDVIGVCQKEDNYRKLGERIHSLNMKKEYYEWYLDLRRYGSVPHSGFGMGIERMLMFITGCENIREVIAFPRTKCKKWIL